MLPEEGVGQSRQPPAPRIRAGWLTQLSRSDPGTAKRRLDAPLVSTPNATLREQPNRIRPPRHQTTPESDAGAAKRAHGPDVDSSNRRGTHDSQGTGSGNYSAQSSRASLGICRTAGHSIRPNARAARRVLLPQSQLQHFPPFGLQKRLSSFLSFVSV
jgi:hypothetical protein